MDKFNSSQRSSLISSPLINDPPAEVDHQVMLSVPQSQALEWLMNGGSMTEAAQFAGVTRQTVSRWLHKDLDFRAAYDRWREQVLDMTEGQLTGLSESAVAALASAVQNHQDVRAAQFVLKHLAMIGKRK